MHSQDTMLRRQSVGIDSEFFSGHFPSSTRLSEEVYVNPMYDFPAGMATVIGIMGSAGVVVSLPKVRVCFVEVR